jgi:hypothetical protein
LESRSRTAIENDLLGHVERGTVIQGTNGARKARIADPHRKKGKRGGFRYIYTYFEPFARVYLLLFYGKNVKDDLSRAEKKFIADSIAKTKESLKRSK